MDPKLVSSEILEAVPLAMRMIRQEMRGLATPELTITQFRILARLYREAHSNKILANGIGIAAPSMSRIVDVLVKRGLVSRSADISDRREVRLFLTAQGKKKFERIKHTVRDRLAIKLQELPSGKRSELMTGLLLLKDFFRSP